MKKLILIGMIMGSAFMQGCAHNQTEKALDKKISQEAAPRGSTDLSVQAGDLILSRWDLTEDQRTRLSELKTETRLKMRNANEDSLKLRSILYKDLASKNPNRREINLIKSKIKNAEKRRVSALLDGIEKAIAILGPGSTTNDKRIDEIYFDLNRDREFPR